MLGRVIASAVTVRFDKPTLLDVPVSNNGGRVRSPRLIQIHMSKMVSILFPLQFFDESRYLQCRYIIYKKNLEDKVAIESPKALGGLKSEQYLKLNPQGLMPLLVLPDGTALPESEVIKRFTYICVSPDKVCRLLFETLCDPYRSLPRS
jgi:glutathione S-transferase